MNFLPYDDHKLSFQRPSHPMVRAGINGNRVGGKQVLIFLMEGRIETRTDDGWTLQQRILRMWTKVSSCFLQ